MLKRLSGLLLFHVDYARTAEALQAPFVWFIIFCVILFPVSLSPGWSVTILGAAALAMAIRGVKPDRVTFLEQVIWIIIAVFLCSSELYAVHRADIERDEVEASIRSQDFMIHQAELRSFQRLIRAGDKLLSQEQLTSNLTRNAMASITGGTSFCYMVFEQRSLDELRPIPWVTAVGRYPLYDLEVRITDADNPGKSPYYADSLTNDLSFSIGNIPGGGARLIPARSLNFQARKSYRLNLFFSARNGFWMEELRGMIINGKWTYAFRVRSGENYAITRKVDIDSRYPRESDGSVKW